MLKSKNRYRNLFEKIEEAFYSAEVIRDREGTIQNWLFLDVNPAIRKLFGPAPLELVGKLASQVLPDGYTWWMHAVRKVMETGQSEHFEYYTQNRYFEVTLYPFGPLQFAALYYDITDKKRRELNSNFLDCITGELACLFAAEEIMETIATLTAEFLQTSGCFFGEIDENRRTGDWNGWQRKDIPDPTIVFDNINEFHLSTIDIRQAGQPVVIPNTASDERIDAAECSAIRIGSLLAVPFIRNERWNASAFLTTIGPRDWRSDEIALFQEICNRVFLRIVNARAETSLRESELKFRTLFETMDKGVCFIEMTYNPMGVAEDWIYLSANSTFTKQFGFDPPGKMSSETALPPKASWLLLFAKVIANRQSIRIEEAIADRWFSIYAAPVGEIGDTIAVMFEDITGHKLATLQRMNIRARFNKESADIKEEIQHLNDIVLQIQNRTRSSR